MCWKIYYPVKIYVFGLIFQESRLVKVITTEKAGKAGNSKNGAKTGSRRRGYVQKCSEPTKQLVLPPCVRNHGHVFNHHYDVHKSGHDEG